MENLTDKAGGAPFSAQDTLRVAICDDEKQIQDMLEEKVKEMLPSAVTETFSSGKELLKSKTEADILFLDIQMPGMDGMETAR